MIQRRGGQLHYDVMQLIELMWYIKELPLEWKESIIVAIHQ
jgi:hypothetical protein